VSSQLLKLGDTVGEGIAKYREQNALMEIGQAAAGGNLQGAQEAAFKLGRPQLGLQVNQLLQQRANRSEDVSFRNQQAERSQQNADRSFGLQAQQVGASAANAAATRDLAKQQFEFNKTVKSQEFQLKLMEIDAKNQKISNILTPGQKKADEAFGKDYVEFRANGGYADVDKQLTQLDGVLKDLESGKKNLTGPVLGSMPDAITAVTNPEAVSARQRVEEVIQRSLRTTLGAQFTQKEGEALIARAYNPRLGEAENASRLRSLIKQIKTMAQQKQSASDYFEKNGTIAGFKGGDQQSQAATASPAAPQSAMPPPPAGFEIVK
jgi:hypothetical protein